MNGDFKNCLTVLREVEEQEGILIGSIGELDWDVVARAVPFLLEHGCLKSYVGVECLGSSSYVWLTSKGEWVLEQTRERPLTGFDYEILGLLNRRRECPIEDIRWQFDGAIERELFDVRLRILCQEGYIQGEGHVEPRMRITEMGRGAVV